MVEAQLKEGKLKLPDTNEQPRTDAPPTDFDDVHRPEYAPTVEILSPLPQETISEDSVLVKVQAQAPRGVVVVEFYIDDEFRESAGLFPFSRRVYFGASADGSHTISVRAADDVGNTATQKISVILNRGISGGADPAPISPAPNATPSVSFLSPVDGAVLSVTQFPVDVRLSLIGADQLRQLNLFYNDVQGNPMLIDSVTENFTTDHTLTWNQAPSSGTYGLYAIWLDQSNNSHRSQINVTINPVLDSSSNGVNNL